jgi:peptidoglycan/xylan/chitin deacetylase (PgdA/CDA1 family)
MRALRCLAAAALFVALGCIAFADAALVARPRAAAWTGVVVLMYHRVDAVVPRDAVGRDLTVTPGAFEAQLRYLRARHIRTLTAEALVRTLAHGMRPQHAVVLTFDDGYDDADTVALPLLRKYGAVGTFYVSSGFVGTPRHLSWKQIREMRAAGMETACHGTFHLDLSTLDRSGQLAEAGGCMRRFARYVGGPAAVTYAYPAGKYDATTFSIMRSLGIVAAFTEQPGAVRDLQLPYALPRRRVRHDDVLASFAALVTP